MKSRIESKGKYKKKMAHFLMPWLAALITRMKYSRRRSLLLDRLLELSQ